MRLKIHNFVSQIDQISVFLPLEIVDLASETQH